MTITKKEIRKELSDLKTLSRTFKICLMDYDLRKGILIKMAKKFLVLIDECLERKLSDIQVEELTELKKDIRIHLKGDDDIYTFSEYELNAVMNCGFIIFDVIFFHNI